MALVKKVRRLYVQQKASAGGDRSHIQYGAPSSTLAAALAKRKAAPSVDPKSKLDATHDAAEVCAKIDEVSADVKEVGTKVDNVDTGVLELGTKVDAGVQEVSAKVDDVATSINGHTTTIGAGISTSLDKLTEGLTRNGASFFEKELEKKTALANHEASLRHAACAREGSKTHKINVLEARVAALAETNTTSAETIAALQKKDAKQEAEIARLTNALAAANAANSSLVATNAELAATNSSLAATVDRMTRENKRRRASDDEA